MRELLLLKIQGQRYGVWKDQVVSVKDIKALHRLPLSPACIAGISIIDDRTVTLADLPVCMGYASQGRDGTGRILMLPGPEKITGFMVSGDIDSLTLGDDAEFPMPEYLKTEVIDSCAVQNATPIPVINVLNLSSQLLKSDHELPRADFIVPHAERGDRASLSAVRVFELGGEPYAAASEGMEEQSTTPGRLAQLALVPQFVKGITFYNGAILPVIDLSQRIKRQKSRAGACAIMGDISGLKFALLADKDRGTVAARDIIISDLPPIARTRSISAVVLKAGEIIPLVELAALLSQNGKDPGEKPLDRRYTPDSEFGSLFRKQDVDVVEFSLLGTRHALPRSEVEDVVPFKSYRRIPDTLEIVVGVAEHKGTLLPVLDLAMVFGRRSLASPQWRMMLVQNGDFRALVITEAVYGERRLPLDIQRTVPIKLPHHVVYGCYPDAQIVRLILNVEAIAVHFEKSLVQDLLPALSEEMMQAPAEIVPSLLGEEAKEAFESEDHESLESSSQTVDTEPESQKPEAVVPEGIESADREAEAAFETKQEEQQPKREEVVQEAREQEPAAALAEADQEQESLSQAVNAGAFPVSQTETAPVFQGAEIRTEESESDDVSAPEEAAAVVGDTAAAEEAVVEETAPDETNAAVPEEAVAEYTAQVKISAVPAEGVIEDTTPVETKAAAPEEAVAEDTALVEAKAATREEAVAQDAAPVEAAQEDAIEEAAPAVHELIEESRVEETPVEAVEEPAAETTFVGQAVQELSPSLKAERELPSESRPEPEPRPEREPRPQPEIAARCVPSELSKSSLKRSVGIGAIMAVLIALLFVLTLFVKPDTEKPVNEIIPAEIAPADIEHKPASVVQKQKPSLELDVPANRAANIDIYVVIKGDTLWSISERFTGNPFNYPRIAGENRIADPDLIFPGQKIRLVKK